MVLRCFVGEFWTVGVIFHQFLHFIDKIITVLIKIIFGQIIKYQTESLLFACSTKCKTDLKQIQTTGTKCPCSARNTGKFEYLWLHDDKANSIQWVRACDVTKTPRTSYRVEFPWYTYFLCGFLLCRLFADMLPVGASALFWQTEDRLMSAAPPASLSRPSVSLSLPSSTSSLTAAALGGHASPSTISCPLTQPSSWLLISSFWPCEVSAQTPPYVMWTARFLHSSIQFSNQIVQLSILY